MRAPRRTPWLVATFGLTLAVAACSLIVDTNGDQCSSDGDCARYGDAVCQVGVCVSRASAVTEAGTAADGNGNLRPDGDVICTPKVPQSQTDILNEPCTNATCIPFDDCARLGLCDGGRPDLVPPPDGGV